MSSAPICISDHTGWNIRLLKGRRTLTFAERERRGLLVATLLQRLLYPGMKGGREPPRHHSRPAGANVVKTRA